MVVAKKHKTQAQSTNPLEVHQVEDLEATSKIPTLSPCLILEQGVLEMHGLITKWTKKDPSSTKKGVMVENLEKTISNGAHPKGDPPLILTKKMYNFFQTRVMDFHPYTFLNRTS